MKNYGKSNTQSMQRSNSSEMAVSSASLPFQFGCLLIILGAFNPAIAAIEAENELSPSYVYNAELGTAYKLFAKKLSWSNARLACQVDGARLAVIDTSEKIKYITSQRRWNTYAWTGIFRKNYRSDWVDVDGDRVTAPLPWKELDYQPLVGDCVALHGQTKELYSRPCSLQQIYICEMPGEYRSLDSFDPDY